MTAQWRKPARWALICAGLGMLVLIGGLLLDRYFVCPPLLIWLLMAMGVIGLLIGAIILLNAVAPHRRRQ